MRLIRALTSKTSSLPGQLFRALVVGGGAFAVDITFLYLFTEVGQLHYLASAAPAFLLGVFLNYCLSVTWVFDRRRLDNRLHEFIIFTCIAIAGLLFSLAIIWFFTETMGLHYLNSKMAAAMLIFLFKFTARKTILFSGGQRTWQRAAAPAMGEEGSNR